jgi:thiamine biosynthesis lipoprotein
LRYTFILAAVLAVGNLFAADRFEFEEPHMGTKIRIVLYAADKATADASAKAAFKRFAELEAVLSDYQQDSEAMTLCRKNDEAPGTPFGLSDDLYRVMHRALDVSKNSEGAFDVTIGPLSQLWRQTKKAKKLPDDATLAAAKAKIGYAKLSLNETGKTLAIKQPGMRLDFGGIGKGFAAEEALVVLKHKGIEAALVAASGDISAMGAPPGKAGWTVDIAPLKPADPPRRLLLKDASVSTSGDLYQHVEIDGIRYSHVLDPKTGLGLTGFRSVTVIAPRGSLADALSKAASILPVERTEKVLAKYGAEYFIALPKETFESKKFHEYLLK